MPATNAVSKEDRRLQRKQERIEAQRKANRNDKLRRNGLWVAVSAIAAAAVAVIVIFATRGGSSDVSGPGTHFNDPITASGQLYHHVPDTQPVTYSHYPPTFGDHYDTPRPWGVYDTQVPEGNFVHNLEHGGIDILYHCPSGCADTVTQLKQLVATLPKEQFGEVKVVMTPYDKSDHLISVLAWDWEQDFDAFDANGIKAFYGAHVDKGPEAIP